MGAGGWIRSSWGMDADQSSFGNRGMCSTRSSFTRNHSSGGHSAGGWSRANPNGWSRSNSSAPVRSMGRALHRGRLKAHPGGAMRPGRRRGRNFRSGAAFCHVPGRIAYLQLAPSCSGLSSTTIRSVSLPGSSVPRSSERPMSAAARTPWHGEPRLRRVWGRRASQPHRSVGGTSPHRASPSSHLSFVMRIVGPSSSAAVIHTSPEGRGAPEKDHSSRFPPRLEMKTIHLPSGE